MSLTATTTTASGPLGRRTDLDPPTLPATRSRRRLGGLACLAAAVLTVAGIALTPFEGDDGTTAGYLTSLVEHPLQAQWAAVVLHFGYVLFVPAFFVCAHLARRRAVRTANTGLVLGVLGATLSGLVASDFYDLNAAQTLGVERAAALSDALGGYGLAALMYVPAIAGMVLGTVLLLVAVCRAGWVSWRVPVLAAVGWFLAYGAHDLVRTLSGFVMVAAALAVVGVRVLRMSDTTWENGIAR